MVSLRSGDGPAPLHLAGWLFADLMIVLMLVTVPASTSTGVRATPTPSPSPSATVVLSPSPSLSATHYGRFEKALQLQPVIIAITVSPAGTVDADEVLRDVRQQLAAQAVDVDARTVGLVLTFGSAPVAAAGQERAGRVNDVLLDRMPAFVGAQRRDYWDGGSLPLGSVRLEVFLFQ